REIALVDAPLLGGLLRGEEVLGIQARVPEDEIERPVVFGRALFGDDFDPAPAGPEILGGVRVLVDPHLLDRRRRYEDTARLRAVDDEGHAVGSDRPRI